MPFLHRLRSSLTGRISPSNLDDLQTLDVEKINLTIGVWKFSELSLLRFHFLNEYSAISISTFQRYHPQMIALHSLNEYFAYFSREMDAMVCHPNWTGLWDTYCHWPKVFWQCLIINFWDCFSPKIDAQCNGCSLFLSKWSQCPKLEQNKTHLDHWCWVLSSLN